MAAPIRPPPPQAVRYRCVVVDLPWDQAKTGLCKVRKKHGGNLPYATLARDEIADIAVGD